MKIEIQPEASVRHGLARIGFSVDTTGSGLSGRALVHAGWYGPFKAAPSIASLASHPALGLVQSFQLIW